MINFWKSLTYTTKFSTIAFVLIAALGLLSMGFLGLLLYYPVSILFQSYPDINDWTGDWVWPAIIVIGMAWSFGFIFGGMAWHLLQKKINSIVLLRCIYIIILWLWAALLFYAVISSKIEAI